MRQRTGCDEYITKVLVMQISFPKDDQICEHCPWCETDFRNKTRKICRLTGEVLPFSDVTIDRWCPLIEGDGEQ